MTAIYSTKLGWHREGDMPAPEFLDELNRILATNYGNAVRTTVFVKFTCQLCHARQTSDMPNAFHPNGYTCEECGKTSEPLAYGVMLEMTAGESL